MLTRSTGSTTAAVKVPGVMITEIRDSTETLAPDLAPNLPPGPDFPSR